MGMIIELRQDPLAERTPLAQLPDQFSNICISRPARSALGQVTVMIFVVSVISCATAEGPFTGKRASPFELAFDFPAGKPLRSGPRIPRGIQNRLPPLPSQPCQA